jgi:hypothetical protein
MNQVKIIYFMEKNRKKNVNLFQENQFTLKLPKKNQSSHLVTGKTGATGA